MRIASRRRRHVLALALALLAPSLGKGADPLDLSFIPRDAIAAVVLHPHALLTEPRYEYLPSEIIIAACEETLGVDPREVHLAIATLSLEGLINGQPNVGAILHFRNPYDQAPIHERMGPNAIELTYNEKKYWKIPDDGQFPLCIAMPTEKVLLLGTESHLTKMLTGEKVDSKLTKLLAATDFSNALVAVLDFSAVRPMLLLGLQQMEPAPPTVAPFFEIPKLLKSIHLSVELSPFALELTFGADDAADATQFKELIDQAKGMVGAMIEEQFAAVPLEEQSKTVLATMQYTRRMIKTLLDSIRVDKEDETVRVALSGDMAPAMATSGVLAALLLPAVQSAREAARRAQTANNLKQIGLAMHNYHDAYGAFPTRCIRDKEGKPLLSWRVAILPFLDQQPLYQQFHLDEPWDSEHNRTLLEKMPTVYSNPNAPSQDATVYLAIDGEGSIFSGDRGTRISAIRDGTSNTILAIEANADHAVPWTKPVDLEFDASQPFRGLGQLRPLGFNVLFADGSVQFLQNSIDPETLRAFITIDGREPVNR